MKGKYLGSNIRKEMRKSYSENSGRCGGRSKTAEDGEEFNAPGLTEL